MQKVEKIKKEYSEKGNHSLLTVLFFYNSIVVLWPILFNSVSFLKSKSIYVALCVLIIAFVYAIMQRNLRLDKKCVVFPMLFIIWGLFSYALNEDTRSQMQTPMYWSLTQTLPAFMLIFSAKDSLISIPRFRPHTSVRTGIRAIQRLRLRVRRWLRR